MARLVMLLALTALVANVSALRTFDQGERSSVCVGGTKKSSLGLSCFCFSRFFCFFLVSSPVRSSPGSLEF